MQRYLRLSGEATHSPPPSVHPSVPLSQRGASFASAPFHKVSPIASPGLPDFFTTFCRSPSRLSPPSSLDIFPGNVNHHGALVYDTPIPCHIRPPSKRNPLIIPLETRHPFLLPAPARPAHNNPRQIDPIILTPVSSPQATLLPTAFIEATEREGPRNRPIQPVGPPQTNGRRPGAGPHNSHPSRRVTTVPLRPRESWRGSWILRAIARSSV